MICRIFHTASAMLSDREVMNAQPQPRR